MERSRPCIQCGKCLEVCPLLRATGREELGPRAKALLAELTESGESDISVKNMAELAGLCLGCHRCEAVCSQGVRPAAVVSRLRSLHPGFRLWLWKRWMETPGAWRLASGVAHLVPRGGEGALEENEPAGTGRLRRAAMLLRGLGGSSQIKPFLVLEENEKLLDKEEVVVFHGCVSSYTARNRKRAAEGLLRSSGAQLRDADFACCGSPLATAGCTDEAAELRSRNVAAWRAAGRPLIVLYCASCRHGLAAYAEAEERGLFLDDGERHHWLGALTPISALLMDARFVVLEGAPDVVAYHRPCHAAVPDTDAALLARILGDRFRELPRDACCGFGGVLQLGAPDLSARVAGDLWTKGRATVQPGCGGTVLTGCSACAVQLAATAPEGVAAGHWLDALARD